MGLLTKIAKRSLENPSTPLSAPDDWLFDSLGSFRASSGVNVNRETALTYDAYWRCIALISGDVAKLPLCVKKVNADGSKEHDTSHPAYKLLRYKASAEAMAPQVKRVLVFHALAEGNGYAYIFRDPDGAPRELVNLSPMKTYPVREDGRLLYVTEVGRSPRRLLPENVFHLKGLSFDGMVGYSAVAKMRESLGMGLAAQNFGSIFFRNNARPNVVLKHPGRLKREAAINLRESWERMHSGLENAHRTAVLEEGMDLVTLMHNAKDSQLLELRGFNRIEICNFFGVPPHKVGDNSRTSYNSLEQENEAYIDDGHGLGYWLCAFEAESWDKLLTEEQKDKLTHVVEFNRAQLLRANLTARTQYYVAGVQNGWLCPDEVREDEGMNPREDGLGKKFVQALNMKTAGLGDPGGQDGDDGGDNKDGADVGKPKKSPAGSASRREIPERHAEARRALRQAHRELAMDAGRRIVRRAAHQAQKAAEKPAEFVAWIERFAGDNRSVAVEVLTPVVRAIRTANVSPRHNRGCDAGAAAGRFLARLRQDLLDCAGAGTAKDLANEISKLARRWEAEQPKRLAAWLTRPAVAQRGKKPTRSTAEALKLLAGMPDADEDGHVGITMPVKEKPPYDIAPDDMKDRTKKKTVKIARLTATRALLDRKRVEEFIKDPEAAPQGEEMDDLPDDRPYVIDCEGELYLYDGNHRVMARQLLGATRVKVYLYKEKE